MNITANRYTAIPQTWEQSVTLAINCAAREIRADALCMGISVRNAYEIYAANQSLLGNASLRRLEDVLCIY